MSALLTDPTVVLVVDGDESRRAGLGEALLDGSATSVEHVASAEAATHRIADGHDVGCVIVTDDLPHDDVFSVREAVRGECDFLPLVAYVDGGDPSFFAALTETGDARFVPVGDTERLRETVDDALATFERRRRRAEESSILGSLLEEAGISIFAKDRQARHVRAAKVPGGYSPERLRGKTDLEVYGEEDPDMAKRAYEDDLRVIEDEDPIYKRDELLDEEPGEYWARTTKVPWRGEDGSVKGLVGISWDITDAVKQERQLERQEERIEQFARYVSHDLRSPLQVATGAIDLARETGDTDSLEKASDALERIDGMLDDLTTMAKEEKESVTFDVGADSPTEFGDGVEIVPLAREVWDVVDAASATLSVEFAENAIVHAPESSLRPILENLFTNAVVHGGPDVTVRIGRLPDGGFYVADDGPGIPERDRERVLEEGYTTAEDGSGTGLRIVSEMVDKHDWDVEIGTSSEGGARVEIQNCLVVPVPESPETFDRTIDLTDDVDVGTVEVDGEATYDEDTDRWTVAGAGSNIWRQENDFHFVYTAVEGSVRVQGRIVEIEELSEYSKAGVMIRDSLDDDATYGYVGVTPRHGTELLWRLGEGANGLSQHLEEESLSYPWYRVERVGDTVTTSLSADGDEWYPVDQRTVPMDEPVYAGLVVCSFTPRRLCEATFSDVSVTAPSED